VFSSVGLRVARNRPYAGGFVTRSYGHPQHGVHAVQIEISRHLYMNEATLARNDGFAATKLIAEKLMLALMTLDISALGGAEPATEIPTEKAAAE
jgi:N-formylglutamate amidohydrolase